MFHMVCSSVNVVILILLMSSFFSFPCRAATACNRGDRDSLLSLSWLSLNWSSSVDCCLWEGVNCGTSDGRVTHLSLPFQGLIGTISPAIANLTNLSYLNLSHNRLSGPLPAAFFSSFNALQILDLSHNHLSGEIPSINNSIGMINSSIQVVDLSSNIFTGAIPSNSFLQAAWNLNSLNLSNNRFTGPLPTNICANSSGFIKLLDLSYNDFNGQISSGLGQCLQLQIFRAGFNDLSGTIPVDFYKVVSLKQLSLPLNLLVGPIDESIVNLTNLTVLELYSNQLIGSIPSDIGKLYNLVNLQLHINNLTGSLPPSLINCTKLTTLNLRVNQLNGTLADFNFSTLINLNTLDLGNNDFTGVLPQSLYSCKKMTAVRLASNQLEGQISPDILELQSLSFLSLSGNNLSNITGAIGILMGFKNLSTVIISKNFMNEALPNDDNIVDSNGFQNLQILALGGCQFTGQVPAWLAKLNSLEVLDLSVNHITGSIPGWMGNLPNLFYLDLSSNLITGGFPKELTRLPALASEQAYDQVDQTYLQLPVFVVPNNATQQQYNQLSNLPPAIYLRNNSLNGDIPNELGQLKFLHVLDLSHNNFSGNIPDALSNLTNLERLDLSGNHLSGEIPASLEGLHFLSYFNVANNSLQGPIPSSSQFDTFPQSSFEGNPGLCGLIVQRSCPSSSGTINNDAHHESAKIKLVVGLVIGICFCTGITITLLALWIMAKRRIIPGGDPDKIELDTISCNSYSGFPPETDKETNLVILFSCTSNEIKDVTISELWKATDNFNQENIIGCGGFALVYKAVLANGTKLAIKKLSGDMGLMEREFKAEVEALSTAQHENLVPLRGYCVHEGFRLLIYSYMENGSLDYWLHEKAEGASQLDWPTRLKIARGASCGLAYMHRICEPHIVHRDIKSSNILLDEKFEARVADFGLSRLILPYHTHVTTELVGTLGYIPPEYGQAWVATLRGDMYSFGVVMLELLTGKRPVEVFKPKMSRELVGWVQHMRSEGQQDEIFDPVLREKGFDEEMLQVLDVACMCVNQNPFKRPTIKEVVDWLENVGAAHRNENKG
ncbi:Pkinase domain-containing protein/LRR_1 domain-containing protein/LRR_7 domain-containing protein/LRR_8 domain-containing protein [Cephalotus follicularis]|uniref:non-specific serine/threonine protein kinase n=1 Tax=Cephalotus follicularis TaxID=3775 RepID=A0A1Q3C2V0_CEPFO|nr:Pkinase domain-containing protein/LRR_1 domain-containing protein/LRR_7 domain-containing protein/LRR_8 domain-containing protein [Cephalotus follicularis]